MRLQRNAAVRRSLGLVATTHVARQPASRARRWTDAEIEVAVRAISGGGTISRHAYKIARRKLDPNESPSANTVYARRPDLFTSI